MFEWCKNLETHLLNEDWETIQDKDLKWMIVSGVTEAARREIIPFVSTRSSISAIEEMIRRFSQKKYDDSKRQESLDKKQREEVETRRAQADKMKRKQEYISRKQESGEDTREHLLPKKSYSYKHMLQTRGAC